MPLPLHQAWLPGPLCLSSASSALVAKRVALITTCHSTLGMVVGLTLAKHINTQCFLFILCAPRVSSKDSGNGTWQSSKSPWPTLAWAVEMDVRRYITEVSASVSPMYESIASMHAGIGRKSLVSMQLEKQFSSALNALRDSLSLSEMRFCNLITTESRTP